MNKKKMEKLDKQFLKEQKKMNKELSEIISDNIFNRTQLTQCIVNERLCIGMADICDKLSNFSELKDRSQHKQFDKKKKQFIGLAKLMKKRQKEVERRWEKIKKHLNQKSKQTNK